MNKLATRIKTVLKQDYYRITTGLYQVILTTLQNVGNRQSHQSYAGTDATPEGTNATTVAAAGGTSPATGETSPATGGTSPTTGGTSRGTSPTTTRPNTEAAR